MPPSPMPRRWVAWHPTSEMQKTVTEAMQNASRQVTAAVEEMRKLMTNLQEETRQATGTANKADR